MGRRRTRATARHDRRAPDGRLARSGGLAWVAAPAALVVLTLAAYQPAFDNEFVYWDDHNYVWNSELVRSSDTPVGAFFTRVFLHNYHPLTLITLHWNRNECPECVHGISARPFVATNVALHIASALLVFALAHRLSGRDPLVASLCAAVFALHPLHVESVAWVSARKDVLMALLFIAGLLAYDRFAEIRHRDGRAPLRWLATACALFVLACLAKATAVVFPVVCLLIDFWRNPADSPLTAAREAVSLRKLIELAPAFAIAAGLGWIALDVQGGGDFFGLLEDPARTSARAASGAFTLLQRLHFAAYGFWAYLVRFVWPAGLSPYYPYPIAQDYEASWLYDAALLAAALLLVATAYGVRRGRLLAFSVGFYLVTVAPVLQLVSVGVVITADRYTYLPYFGPAFAIGVWLSRRFDRRRRPAIYALLAAVSLVWVVQTRHQVDVWQDSESLWTRVIERFPDQIQPYAARGDHFRQMAEHWRGRGDLERARVYAQRARDDYATARRKRALYE